MFRNKTRAVEDINISIALDDFGVIPLICQCKLNDIDPLGCFYFGGSDIVIVFEKKADFEPVMELKKHMLAGECVGEFNN